MVLEGGAISSSVEGILESITDAFVALDWEWRFTYVNQRARQLLGRNSDQLLGMTLWEVFPGAEQSAFGEQFRRARQDNATVRFEEHARTLGRWLAVTAYPSPGGLAIYFQDITDQKRTEDALRASEYRFRRLLESSIIGMLIADLDGRMLEANDALLALIGYSRAELEAGELRWDAITPPEDAEADARAVEQLRAEGFATPFEKHYICKDGTLVPVLLGAARLSEETGETIAYIVDLTQQHRALQAREDFLSIASHELRTPLTALSLQVQMLGRVVNRAGDTMPTDRARRSLEGIEKQMQRLNHLLEELLNVTHISSGKLTLQLSPIDLATVVRDVAERLRPQARQRGSSLTVQADGAVFGTWDPLRLEQIAVNLLSNAIKYGDGGPITVCIGATPNEALLQVRDSGGGIPPEYQTRIFQRFERGAQTAAESGLGLGLFITRELVEAHGGTIGVESAPGEGATFTVTLPRALSAD